MTRLRRYADTCEYPLWGCLSEDRDNIDDDESLAFRVLAKAYAGLTERQVSQLLANKDLMEICHDDKTKIQK
jgi:hypothetical protein